MFRFRRPFGSRNVFSPAPVTESVTSSGDGFADDVLEDAHAAQRPSGLAMAYARPCAWRVLLSCLRGEWQPPRWRARRWRLRLKRWPCSRVTTSWGRTEGGLSFSATIRTLGSCPRGRHTRLPLPSSGSVSLESPGKNSRTTRSSGFVARSIFDGIRPSLPWKDQNVLQWQIRLQFILRCWWVSSRTNTKGHWPAADLLLPKAYAALTERKLIDVKDLGAGVIGWRWNAMHSPSVNRMWINQIWIAQGDRAYPCRYVITAKEVLGFSAIQCPDQRLENQASGAVGATFTFPAA